MARMHAALKIIREILPALYLVGAPLLGSLACGMMNPAVSGQRSVPQMAPVAEQGMLIVVVVGSFIEIFALIAEEEIVIDSSNDGAAIVARII